MPFIGQQPTTGAFLELDSLTASATDQYTLQLNGANYYPETVNNLLVSINGVIQGSSTMSLSGYTLTVGATLSGSDVIDFVRVFGNVGTISTPTDGSVTANKIGTGAVTDAKISTMSSSKLTGALPSSVTSSGIYLGGTGSANKLDDYEEGTWTPSLGGSVSDPTVSYNSSTSGSYIKVGDVVHVMGRVYTSSVSGGSGTALIRGLPFATSGSYRNAGALGYISSVSLGSGYTQFGLNPDIGTSTIRLVQSGSGIGANVITVGVIGNSFDLTFSHSYRV